MRHREEEREIKRQPGQPLPGERGREKGGKPEMGREHVGQGGGEGGGQGGKLPTGPSGASVE